MRNIILNRCARCGKGKFFSGEWYHPGRFAIMNPHCPQCHQNFRQGPGFYFGATYVSYLVQIVLFLLLYLLIQYILDTGFWTYIGIVVVVQLLLMPLTFRFARLTWFTMFGNYKREQETDDSQQKR